MRPAVVVPIFALVAVIALAAPRLCPQGAAHAASFNCAQAGNATEVAICANPTLNAMDGALGLAYQQRLPLDPSVRQVQRAWLKARNEGCGHDVGCLERLMSAQLAWLRRGGPLPIAIPRQVGICSLTAVKQIEGRLEGDPSSGSAVEETNGAYQVSYDMEPGIQGSRRGDPVLLCLVSLPQHCPPGDDRGRVYAGANLRTLGAWSLPDAEHMCGGA